MAKKNIGATLSLNNGNFFTNIKSAVSGTNQLKTATTDATGNLKKMGSQSANTGGSCLSLAKAVAGVAVAYKGIKAGVSFLKECADAAQKAEVANIKLETVMKNQAGVTDAQVDAVKDACSALSSYTTIGGSAAKMGASQLAVFGLQSDSISKLLPSIGDLAVGINGINVGQEDMEKYALMVGKAMSGNTGALKKAGIVLDENAQKILKNGTESEKLAVITDAVSKSYGGMAEKMAATPEGRIMLMQKAWSKVKVEIGKGVLPIITEVLEFMYSKVPAVQSAVLTAVNAVKPVFSYIITNVLPAIGNLFDVIGTIAGRVWDSIKSAVTSASERFDGIKPNIDGVGTALNNAFEFCRPVLDWLIDTGIPLVVDALAGVLSGAMGVYNFFVNNWSWIAPIIAGIAGALLAYKVAVIAVNVVENIRAAVTGVVTAAQWLMNVAMSANPIGIIILAIGALIAIGVALWMNWDAVCEWCKQAFAAVGDWFVGIGTAIGDFFTGMWTGISNVVISVWDGITGFLSGTWSAISGTAIAVFEGIKTAILGVWNGIVSGIKGAINLIIGGINGLIRGFVGGINGLINGVNTVTGAIGIPAIPTFTAPQIPMLAKGGDIVTSGRVLVGERGAEYLDLPKGARVTPLDKGGKNDDGRTYSILAGIGNAITDACGDIANAVRGFISGIAGGLAALNVEPSPIIEMPNPAQDGIIRPSVKTDNDRQPKNPPPPKEPKPSPEDRKTENNFYITINADGKSSDEIVDDLMPKLKLALANL